MVHDLIRYDLLVQDALRRVLSKVLGDAAKDGLPGDHYFRITFKTHVPGVRMSQRLRDQYPDDMTIVLRYQFSNLVVTEKYFEVVLSFSGIPETLVIPFNSIIIFQDPSIPFILTFQPEEAYEDSPLEQEEKEEPNTAQIENFPTPAKQTGKKKTAKKATTSEKKSRPQKDTSVTPKQKPKTPPAVKTEAEAPATQSKAKRPAQSPSKGTTAKEHSQPAPANTKSIESKPSSPSSKPPAPSEEKGAEIVSLDAFRKKT